LVNFALQALEAVNSCLEMSCCMLPHIPCSVGAGLVVPRLDIQPCSDASANV
jgi:hypothetical protein